MNNEIVIPKDREKVRAILRYLYSLPAGSWYWTLEPKLFTFVDEADEIIFRLNCEL